MISIMALSAAYVVWRTHPGSRRSPSRIYVLTWIIALSTAQLVKASFWGGWASWYIVASCLSALLGGWIALSLQRRPHDAFCRPLAVSVPGRRMRRLVAVLSLCHVAAATILLRTIGLSPWSATSLEALSSVANSVSVARYEGVAGVAFISPILLAFGFAGAALAGMSFAVSKQRYYLGVALFGPAIYSVLTTARSTAITAGVFFLAGFITEELRIGGGEPRNQFLRSILVGLLGVGSVCFVVLIGLLRVGPAGLFDQGIRNALVEKGLITVAGGPVAFDEWFEQADERGPSAGVGVGSDSIADIRSLRGGQAGFYGDTVETGASGLRTNVYSAFRGLISDFGIAGALLIHLVLGFVTTMSGMRLGRSPSSLPSIMICFVAFTLAMWAPIISLAIYQSYFLAVALTGILIVHYVGTAEPRLSARLSHTYLHQQAEARRQPWGR